MTYNVGPFYLTLLTIAHPMFVFRNNTSKHPMHHSCWNDDSCARDVSDYEYLALHYTDALQKKENKASRVMFKKVPTNAGEKPSSKRRKGKNNVETRPIIEEEDSHNLSHPKAPSYTEYFPKDEPFYVVFAKNHPQASQCISCDIAFPRRMPLAPCDLAFSHKSLSEYPVKDDKRRIVEKKITKTKLTNQFYCLHPKCVLKRPYL